MYIFIWCSLALPFQILGGIDSFQCTECYFEKFNLVLILVYQVHIFKHLLLSIVAEHVGLYYTHCLLWYLFLLMCMAPSPAKLSFSISETYKLTYTYPTFQIYIPLIRWENVCFPCLSHNHSIIARVSLNL